MKIHDLDVLRPEPEIVKLAGKEIDISYIPSGVALDIMSLRQELEDLTNTQDKVDKIEEGGEEAQKSFDIAADICSKITSAQHEEMTKEWLLVNTDIIQLRALIDFVTNAVFKSLGDADQKNPIADKPE